MRRFPISWTETLTALGLKRKRRNKGRAYSESRRIGLQLETLEQKIVLSADPIGTDTVSDEIIVSSVQSDASSTGTLVVDYQIVGGDGAEFFDVSKTTNEAGNDSAKLFLKEGVEAPLGVELTVQIEETYGELFGGKIYDVTVTLHKDNFLEAFKEDRIELAQQEAENHIAQEEPAVIPDEEIELTVTVAPIPELSEEETLEQLFDQANNFAEGEGWEELLRIFQYDNFSDTVEDAISYGAEEEAGNALLLLTDQIHEDINNGNEELATSAQGVLDTLSSQTSHYFTIWTGLDVNHRLIEGTRDNGTSDYAFAVYESGDYEVIDGLSVEFDRAASIEVTSSSLISTSFSSAVMAASALVIEGIADVKDTTLTDIAMNFDQNSGAYAGNLGGDELEALFGYNVDSLLGSYVSDATASLSFYNHYPDLVGVAPENIVNFAYRDWAETAQPADFDASFFGGIAETIIPGSLGSFVDIPITEAVQRATKFGDANLDGVIDSADVDAFHRAVTNLAGYYNEYGLRANYENDITYSSDANWDNVIDSSDRDIFFSRLGEVLGDYNLDGVVDGADHTTWAINYGSSSPKYTSGDGNFDGLVDAADYTVYQDHSGETSTSPDQATVSLKVNEGDNSPTNSFVGYTTTNHASASTWGPELEVTLVPDIIAKQFSTSLDDLSVVYNIVNEDFSSIDIEVWRSSDGITPDTGGLLMTHEVNEASNLAPGHHKVQFTADFVDDNEDYQLLVQIVGSSVSGDPEYLTTNNSIGFTGGIFEGPNKTVQVHGTASNDYVSIEENKVTLVSGNGILDTYLLGGIDFDEHTLTDYGSLTSPRDGVPPQVKVLADGGDIYLQDNMWRAIDFNYSITANTVIEFDYFSTNEGEFHGFGFDDNLLESSSQLFRLHGYGSDPAWQTTGESDYSTSEGVRHYKVDIGQFYTGTFDYLVFAASETAAIPWLYTPGTNATFSNVQVYESNASITPASKIYARLHEGDDTLESEALVNSPVFAAGGDGNDDLQGTDSFFNILYGGEGDDFFRTAPGAANEIFYEGLGDDTFLFSENTLGTVFITKNNVSVTGGIDTFDFSELTSGVEVNLSNTGIQQLYGDTTLNLFIESVGVNPAEIENVIGTIHDDVITGNEFDNIVDAGAGNDEVHGAGGDDAIFGGLGDDDLFGDADDDYLVGNDGIDELFGGMGEDELLGGQGDDVLNGGDQADTLDGGPDIDTYEVTSGDGYENDLYFDNDGTPSITSGGVTNIRPTFGSIPNYASLTVDEEYSLTLNADPGEVGQTITYEIVGDPLPTGATFVNGVFTWTPTTSDEGTEYNLVVKATDTGSLALSTLHSLRLAVGQEFLSPIEEFRAIPIHIKNSDIEVPSYSVSWDRVTSGVEHFIEYRELGDHDSVWTTLLSTTNSQSSNEIEFAVGLDYDPFSNITYTPLTDAYAIDELAGLNLELRIAYTDLTTSVTSPYTYTTLNLHPGSLTDISYNDSSGILSWDYPTDWKSGIQVSSMTPDYVIIEKYDDQSDTWTPHASVFGTSNSYTFNTSDTGVFRLGTESNGSTVFEDLGWFLRGNTTSDTFAFSQIYNQGYTNDDHSHSGESLGSRISASYQDISTTEKSVFIGTDNDFDLGLTNSGDLVPDNFFGPNASYAVSDATEIRDLDRSVYKSYLLAPSSLYLDNVSYEYTAGIGLYPINSSTPVLSGDSIYEDGVFGSNINSLVYEYRLEGFTPSVSKGDKYIQTIAETYLDGNTSNPTNIQLNTSVTVVDIDLEIGGLDNYQEFKTGAIIQTNSDFSKGLEDNGTPIPDNNRNPNGEWVYDASNLESMTPATLSWNANVHEDLDIVLTYPDDVLVWSVEPDGSNGVLIPSGVPITSLSNGLDLRIEGIKRSTSFATTSIEAKFVDPNNLLSVVDTDEAKYTVVDFNLLVDGDRDGVFEEDDASDRELYFWYNTDADRTRGEDAGVFDVQQQLNADREIGSDVTSIGYYDDYGNLIGRDAQDAVIYTAGDLEDFSSLLLKTDEILNDLPAGFDVRYYVTVESTAVEPTSINLYSGRDGGTGTDPTDHLFGVGANTESSEIAEAYGVPAADDAGYVFESAVLTRSSSSMDIPEQTLPSDGLNDSGSNLFLFEAVPGGIDAAPDNLLFEFPQSSVNYTFHAELTYEDGTTYDLASTVDLELYDIVDFYDVYEVTATENEIADPNLIFDDATLVSEGAVLNAASSPFLDDEDLVLFIHGWNNDQLWKKTTADTAFKRLYHQGYNGQFASFKWPTQTGTFSYNTSDNIAYRSATALKNLLEDINVQEVTNGGPTPSIMAHSMGNVVTSEALRLWQIDTPTAAIETYIATNAAVSADAYGATVNDPEVQNYYHNFPANSDLLTQKYMFVNSASAASNWFNYYYEEDAALNLWNINDAAKKAGGIFGLTPVTDPIPYNYVMSGDTPARRTLGLVGDGPIEDNPSEILRTVKSITELKLPKTTTDEKFNLYEVIAFLAVSDNQALGTMAMGGRFSDKNIATLGLTEQIPGSEDLANHSYQFLYDVNITNAYWQSIMADTNWSSTQS